MTQDAAQSLGNPRLVPGRLRTPFTILGSSLVLLAIAMLFVFFWIVAQEESATLAVGERVPNPWAPVAWLAMWGALGLLAVCALIVPGIALCVHPALFALLGPDAGLPDYTSARRWPRLTGLALVWGGVGAVALMIPPLAQTSAAAHGLIPDLNSTLAIATLVVAMAPVYFLLLAAILLHLVERRQPANDGHPPTASDHAAYPPQ